MEHLLFKDEVYKIIGLCMEVYNTLGYGFLEIIYKDAIQIELEANNIPFVREKEFPVFYKGNPLKRTFFSDFLVFDTIIVEVKAGADGIAADTFSQTINYLKASKKKVGVIINFGKRKLEYKRVVV
jgi:GxxExxY protein